MQRIVEPKAPPSLARLVLDLVQLTLGPGDVLELLPQRAQRGADIQCAKSLLKLGFTARKDAAGDRDVPERLATALERGLAPSPTDRPPSARAFGRSLAESLDRRRDDRCSWDGLKRGDNRIQLF